MFADSSIVLTVAAAVLMGSPMAVRETLPSCPETVEAKFWPQLSRITDSLTRQSPSEPREADRYFVVPVGCATPGCVGVRLYFIVPTMLPPEGYFDEWERGCVAEGSEVRLHFSQCYHEPLSFDFDYRSTVVEPPVDVFHEWDHLRVEQTSESVRADERFQLRGTRAEV